MIVETELHALTLALCRFAVEGTRSSRCTAESLSRFAGEGQREGE